MLVHVLALALALGVDLVYAHLLVPAGNSKQVCSAREGKVGDSILGGLGHLDILGEVSLGVGCSCCRRGTAAKKA